jgi:1-acyl-sn-glycerol-3-phosphate acyltransferase
LSEAAKQVGGPGEGGPRADEPATLPPWAFDVLRSGTRMLSRALWRVSFRGVEHVPREGGLIIAANHQTYIDPFWIGAPFDRQLRFLAWDAIFGWPVAGQLIRWLGAWPLQVERGDTRAIRRSVQWLREGGALVIFPEGGRGRGDAKPEKFKTGAARLALEADVPILPVTIRGGHTVWPRGPRRPRTGRVAIVYHPPRRVRPRPGEDARQCARRETDALAEVIAAALP